ncbi:MAG TPA: PAS domain S-box protein, partial [Chthoniobacterales bacterium]
MSPDASLTELADFLCARRAEITRRCADALGTAPGSAASTELRHEQLLDHLPRVFDALAETLRSPHPRTAESAVQAHAHPEDRWWERFEFAELLGHVSVLRRIVSVEYLSAFAAEHTDWSAEARAAAETVVHTFFDRILTEAAQPLAAATRLLRGQSASAASEIVRGTEELVDSNKQLRRGEERFKLAVAIAQMGTFEIDLRTDAVVVNEEARQIYGWAPDAPLTFSKVQTHFHADDREHVLRAVGAAFDPATESDEFDVEQRIFRTDGEMRWIRVRARAFFEGEGAARQAVVCVGTFLDITERKEHEAAMHESEARFRQLADAIPQLAWMAKPDGWIFWYNQRWHEFTGTTPEEMEGWGWQSVHDPKELPRIIDNWKAALASERPWEDTFPLRRHDGEFRVHLSRANPFRDSRGRVVLWFGTNTDITELVRAEEAAQAANRAKDQFIAVLSHELRTPLTPVLATIMDLNAHVDLPPAISEAIDLIRRNVELEARLIDDLLDVTRISKGKLSMDRQVVPLDSILRDAMRICESEIAKKQVNVALDLQAPNHRVEGDGARLLQAFWNLLQNAVKFTPAGGEITVRTHGD